MRNEAYSIDPGILAGPATCDIHGFGERLVISPRFSIQGPPKPLIPASRLISVWDVDARGNVLPELLRELLHAHFVTSAAEDAVRALLCEISGGDAAFRALLAEGRTYHYGFSRPLVLPRRVPVAALLLEPATAGIVLPTVSTRVATPTPSPRLRLDTAAKDESPRPDAAPLSLPLDLPSVAPALRPVAAGRRQAFASDRLQVSGSPVGSRIRRAVGSLAAAIAIIIVLPSYSDRRAAPPAVDRGTLWLVPVATSSALLATRMIGKGHASEAARFNREPPRNPFPSVAAEPAALAPATPEAKSAASLIVAPTRTELDAQVRVPRMTLTRVTAPSRHPRGMRKKNAGAIAAAARRRPDVAALMLPDVLKPQ